MDLIEVDSINDLKNQENVINGEILQNHNSNIKEQYLEFINLGTNLLDNIEDQNILSIVLSEFLEYVHENITPVTNFEQYDIEGDSIEIGTKIYNFLCVDCYNTIIPNFLEIIQVSTFEEFETYYLKQLKGDSSFFKANFVKSIQTIKNNIQKLQKLDKTIKNDKNYQDLLEKYKFYVQLMNFGNVQNFLDNYFKPVFAKNESDIIWRIS